MAPTLYSMEFSAPAKAPLLVARAINLDVDVKVLNPMKGEHLAPDFLKINPEHTVPTLVDDDGYVLWDSHAINAYLVDKYAPDDPLYPKDLQKRGTINQRLFFDAATIQARMGAIVGPIVREGLRKIPKDKSENLIQAYATVEAMLEKSPYVAGDEVTIADLSIAASLTSSNGLAPIAENRFPKITEWLSRMEGLPYFKEVNQPATNKFIAFIRSRLI